MIRIPDERRIILRHRADWVLIGKTLIQKDAKVALSVEGSTWMDRPCRSVGSP